MIFQPPKDLLRSVFETLLNKLYIFKFFQKQFLQLRFKYTSEQILVEIWCLKHQKLLKTLIVIVDFKACTGMHIKPPP